jgi:hypothetical protein
MRIAVASAALLFAFGSTPLPADDDPSVLFSDDFSTLDPGWGEADDKWNVADGKLIVKPRANGAMARLYGGTLFGDADIRVKVAQVDSADGGTNQVAGIIFWADDPANYYIAAIHAGGGYYIGRKTDGTWKVPQSLILRSEVRKGVGQSNELRVVTDANSAKISVTVKQITTLEGYKHPEQSMIGLQAESYEKEVYTWAFSDLVVRKPE